VFVPFLRFDKEIRTIICSREDRVSMLRDRSQHGPFGIIQFFPPERGRGFCTAHLARPVAPDRTARADRENQGGPVWLLACRFQGPGGKPACTAHAIDQRVHSTSP
jgi:hypothetical protein